MPVLGYIALAIAAYLSGSIPTGYLVARARGVDIRKVGSGNIGATNVFRILGKPAGVFVLFVDAFKGWFAVFVLSRIVWSLWGAQGTAQEREWFSITASVFAILGHNYTCWLGFKGGKGIATSAGVLTALVPWSLLVILCVWLVVFALSRYVSLASICASAALPFAAWLTGESSTIIIITLLLAALAIYKHKSNIRRLKAGTENRISFNKKAEAQAETRK